MIIKVTCHLFLGRHFGNHVHLIIIQQKVLASLSVLCDSLTDLRVYLDVDVFGKPLDLVELVAADPVFYRFLKVKHLFVNFFFKAFESFNALFDPILVVLELYFVDSSNAHSVIDHPLLLNSPVFVQVVLRLKHLLSLDVQEPLLLFFCQPFDAVDSFFEVVRDLHHLKEVSVFAIDRHLYRVLLC